MEYELKKMNGYDLHLFKTNKFKTNNVTIKFLTELNRSNVTERALLPYVLKAATKNYPNKRELTLKTEELFDCNLRVSSNRYGSCSLIQFTLSFINQKFISQKDLTEEAIKFLKEIIFNPFVNNNSFDEKILDEEKRLLAEETVAMYENKNLLALKNFIDCMFEKNDFTIPSYGFTEDYEKITGETLYKAYLSMLENDMIDIVVTGDYNDDFVNLIEDSFIFNNKKMQYNPVKNFNVLKNEIKKVIESDEEVNQAKIYLGYQCDLDPYSFDFYSGNLFAVVLGQSPCSKLFMNVREKASLCYYVSCSINIFGGFGYVYAGINSENFDKAIDIVNKQIEDMCNGLITDEEIDFAKKYLVNTLLESEDNQYTSASKCYSEKLFNRTLDLNEIIKNYNSVTKEQIVDVAKKFVLDTIYMLKEK